MTYGLIELNDQERDFLLSLVRASIALTADNLAAATDDLEKAFYRSYGDKAKALLGPLSEPVRVALEEDQLRILKGLIGSTFPAFIKDFDAAKAREDGSHLPLSSEWILRENLSTLLDAPFVADSSQDAEEDEDEDDTLDM